MARTTKFTAPAILTPHANERRRRAPAANVEAAFRISLPIPCTGSPSTTGASGSGHTAPGTLISRFTHARSTR